MVKGINSSPQYTVSIVRTRFYILQQVLKAVPWLSIVLSMQFLQYTTHTFPDVFE